MKRIVKRIIIIGVLAFLTGALFYALHIMMIKSAFWYDEWAFVEKVLYIVFALLIGTIYKCLPAKIIVSMGLSAAFTVGVFLANNYFHYLHWNAIIFNWRYDFPYSHFVKYDLQYKVGYGEYRYILVFLAMCLANLAIIVYFKWISPVLKNGFRRLDFGTLVLTKQRLNIVFKDCSTEPLTLILLMKLIVCPSMKRLKMFLRNL